jgi:hypothetical protein
VPAGTRQDVDQTAADRRSVRSTRVNQSIWTPAGVTSSTEKPCESKSRYLMCGLLALIAVSTAREAVRGGVPRMSSRLSLVTDVQTSSTPTLSPVVG